MTPCPHGDVMLGSSRSAPKPIPDSLRNSLKELRQGLLNLHKALIVSEQITYERIYGRIASSGQLLILFWKGAGETGRANVSATLD